MILLPRELPDLRTHMAEFCESRQGPLLHHFHLGHSEPGAAPDGLDLSAKVYARLDGASFRDAALYYINTDMVDLLMQAKDGIGETGFMEYDLPTPVGMAYLDKDLPNRSPVWGDEYPDHKNLPPLPDLPVAASDEDRAEYEKLVALRAELADRNSELARMVEVDRKVKWPERLLMLWRWMPPELPEYPHGWVRVAWYEDRDSFEAKVDALGTISDRPILNRDRITASNAGRFVFDGHQVIACHPEASEVRVERFDGDDTWRERRSDMFRALCFLLRQRVAGTETVMPDRAAQRRAKREGKEPPPVRIISIRGTGHAGSGGDGQREYHHRWMVRGHWRMQPCGPNRSLRRPTWVMPHVKGPDDAPLLGGEKVYSVRT